MKTWYKVDLNKRLEYIEWINIHKHIENLECLEWINIHKYMENLECMEWLEYIEWINKGKLMYTNNSNT